MNLCASYSRGTCITNTWHRYNPLPFYQVFTFTDRDFSNSRDANTVIYTTPVTPSLATCWQIDSVRERP